MIETHEYLVPDYYPHFKCKMGACRSACCVGWPITLSRQDYFHLLGVPCSKHLRAKLDCAMAVLPDATPEAYARIEPAWDGDCPLRMTDGRCGVQAELGEAALADICRLYPRAPRAEGDYECSCANSCEAVLELMFSRRDLIRFIPMPLTFDLPAPAGRTVFFETVGREQEIRLHFIHIMQERIYSLPQRLMNLGAALRQMEAALNAGDKARVETLLTTKQSDRPIYASAADHASLMFSLDILERIMELVDERSTSVRSYGQAALAFLRSGNSTALYHATSEHLEQVLPRWPVYFEHILVNHMFFERFPFQDRPNSLSDEYVAICALYAMLRFLSLGCMAEKDTLADFVDICAAAFRLVSHTSFDHYAANLLKQLGCCSEDKLLALISF